MHDKYVLLLLDNHPNPFNPEAVGAYSFAPTPEWNISMTITEKTQNVARRYFQAWTTRDSETVRQLLAEALHFSFMTNTTVVVEGRDAFLSGEAWPEGVRTTLVAEAYQGETAFQMYEARNGAATLRVVEKFVVHETAEFMILSL